MRRVNLNNIVIRTSHTSRAHLPGGRVAILSARPAALTLPPIQVKGVQIRWQSQSSPQPDQLSAFEKFRSEALRFYHGFLGIYRNGLEVRMLKEKEATQLTRREVRLIKQTQKDLLALIPFAVLVVLPLTFLILPAAIVLFPALLPSTFTDEKSRLALEEATRKIRTQIISQIAVGISGFNLRDSEYHENMPDFSFEALHRPAVLMIFNFFRLGLSIWKPVSILSAALRSHFSSIRDDDHVRIRSHHLKSLRQLIRIQGGATSLTHLELRQALLERGLPFSSSSPATELAAELDRWLARPQTDSDEMSALYALNRYRREGRDKIIAISTAFYTRVYADSDPAFRGRFRGEIEDAIQDQYEFFIQRWGGPPLYSQRKGHPALRARHVRFPITHDMLQALKWLSHMNAALDEVGLQGDMKVSLRSFLRLTTDQMAERPVARSNDSYFSQPSHSMLFDFLENVALFLQNNNDDGSRIYGKTPN